jgi:hypothetical protein
MASANVSVRVWSLSLCHPLRTAWWQQNPPARTTVKKNEKWGQFETDKVSGRFFISRGAVDRLGDRLRRGAFRPKRITYDWD